MEEQLYFEPASRSKKSSEKSKKTHKIRKLLLLLTIVAIIVLIIIWFLRGKTTISGNYPENVKNEALTCISNDIIPEKLASANSNEKELRINAIFSGDSKLKNISLIYTVNYSSEENAYGAEAKTHAELNHALNASGYNSQKFNNKFARYGEKLIISLYATQTESDEIAAQYFMITLDGNHKVSVENISDYKQNYENQGFKCESTEENNL